VAADADRQGGFDALVRKLLADAGYPDVAAKFGRQAGGETAGAEVEARSAWHVQRVQSLLGRQLSVSAALAGKLARLVVAKLESLGFVEVGDALILNLAEHTLDGLARAYRTVPADHGGWLMPAGYWEAFFAGRPARLVADGVLKVHPVSELFPVLRLTVEADRAMQLQLGGEGLGELGFLPLWEDCCAGVAEAIATLVREAGELAPGHRKHPVLVTLSGLKRAVRGAEPSARRAAKQLAERAARMLTEAIAGARLHALISVAE